MVTFFVFVFLKKRTAYEIRPRDWSSDVCSSDLWCPTSPASPTCSTRLSSTAGAWPSDRKSVVEGKRVDLGGRRLIKKKKEKKSKLVAGVAGHASVVTVRDVSHWPS